ncbi:MAG: PfkB family carbohydrate kinase [bacterium]
MSILIVGTLAFDTIETVWGKVERVLGGSATHSSIAANLFVPVKVAGIVGEDFGEEYFDFFRRHGIDTRGVARAKGKTFFWSGLYGENPNERETLATEVNVFADFNPVLPDDYIGSPYLFLANMSPSLQLRVLDMCKGTRFSILDTMNYWIESENDALWEALRRVDAVLLNDSEARQLCGTPNLMEAARKILSVHPKVVIIKKGEHGALMVGDNFQCAVPAFPVERVKDPTGAGDTFAGGFLGYVASQGAVDDRSLRGGMVMGTVLASFCVEDFGVKRLEDVNRSDIKFRIDVLHRLSVFEPVDPKLR